MADGYPDDAALTKTIARILHDAGVGEYRDDDQPFTPGAVAIFYGPIGDTVDQAIGIRVYATSDDIATGLATRRAQLRYRGPARTPDGADTIAGAVFSTLHGLARVAGISLAARVLSAPLGADQNGRQERADSYQITLDNPEA